MSKRLWIFVGCAFAITWIAWGWLVMLARQGTLAYGQWRFMSLYIVGGLGPTLAAFVAVAATPEQAPLGEFLRRLARWRLAPAWYLAALGLPIGVATIAMLAAWLMAPQWFTSVSFKPWLDWFVLFAIMLVGGGLEELGWRGVAQEELLQRTGEWRASTAVGLLWALWHLPLFVLPGVAQFGGNFATFAAGIFANALLLGWLYTRTRSILLCIFFHAAANATAAFGVAVPHGSAWAPWLAPLLGYAIGLSLLRVRSCDESRNGVPAAR